MLALTKVPAAMLPALGAHHRYAVDQGETTFQIGQPRSSTGHDITIVGTSSMLGVAGAEVLAQRGLWIAS